MLIVVLLSLGSFLFLSGGFWLLVLAFSESILWGLGTLLLWPVMPITFTLITWPRARLALILHAFGVTLLMLAGLLWIAPHAQGLF